MLGHQEHNVPRAVVSEPHRRPPLRLLLVRAQAPGQHLLLLRISMHHATYDGQSFAMLLDEVAVR